MADQLGSAVLTVSVDNTQLNAGLQAAQRQATTAGRSIGDGLSNAFKSIAGIAGVVGIGALTQQLISTGKESEKTKIQLNALSAAYGETAQATSAVQRTQQILGLSALDARSQFAKLYGSLRGAGIGLNQIEVLFVGINNAARLSGAGTQEAANALIQLKQGLASGRLAGDELRSVLEQLPVFAQAVAKEMGVSVGDLRDLGSEGKITSGIIFNAAKQLATATVPARTQAEQLGIAYTNLKESATEALGPALVGLITNVTAGIAAFSQFIKNNQEVLANFGKAVVNLGRILLPFAAGILAVRAAFQAWALASKAVAVAQAAVLALSGPKGWLVLAGALAAAGGAAFLLEKGYEGIGKAVGQAAKEAEKAKAQFAALLGGTKLESLTAAADPKVVAQQQQQRVESQLALQAVEQRIAAAKELAGVEAGILRQTIQQRQEIQAGVQAARDQVSRVGAQIDSTRLQGGDNGPQLQKLVAEQKAAAAEVRLKLIEGATALRDAGKQLTEDFNAAVLRLASVRSDPNGLNQYLSGQQANQRNQQTLAMLMPQFREAQAQFTQLTGAQAPEFNGSTSGVIDAVQKFIDNVNKEKNANKEVQNIQAALNENTKNLVTVNEALVTELQSLAAKDWAVNVTVAANGQASVYGDAVTSSF